MIFHIITCMVSVRLSYSSCSSKLQDVKESSLSLSARVYIRDSMYSYIGYAMASRATPGNTIA